MTTESKLLTVLLLMLTGIVLLLMVAIIALFVRMNQLQEAVLAAQPVVRVSGADVGGRCGAGLCGAGADETLTVQTGVSLHLVQEMTPFPPVSLLVALLHSTQISVSFFYGHLILWIHLHPR